jgi:uncharacterized Zn finger protein
MEPDAQQRPPDCTCDGEGLQLVSSLPRVGAMPELHTYRCESCGHVETVEATQSKPKPRLAAS